MCGRKLKEVHTFSLDRFVFEITQLFVRRYLKPHLRITNIFLFLPKYKNIKKIVTSR